MKTTDPLCGGGGGKTCVVVFRSSEEELSDFVCGPRAIIGTSTSVIFFRPRRRGILNARTHSTKYGLLAPKSFRKVEVLEEELLGALFVGLLIS
jgi:hypothetical protein